jgi:hypothetical protein
MTRQTFWYAAMVLVCGLAGFALAGQAGVAAVLAATLIVACVQAVSPGPAVQLVPVRIRRDDARRRREPY